MAQKGGKSRFIPFLVIAILSILVYANALDNGFHYDDEQDIVPNSFLGKWENIPLLFTSVEFYRDEILNTDHYRPLVYVTYALNKAAGGNNPAGYHMVNLAFHIGAAFLLFLIVRAMLEGQRDRNVPPIDRRGFLTPSIAAALIFAVHPFNSEAVNYITARSSLMSGFFYLLAFWCWVQYRKVAGSSEQVAGKIVEGASSPATCYLLPATYYTGSLFAFLLAMLSKESAITLPVVLWLYDLYFYRSVQRRDRNVPPIDTGQVAVSGKQVAGKDRKCVSSPATCYPLPAASSAHWLSYRAWLPYLPFVLAVAVPALVIRVLYWGAVVLSYKRPFPVQLYTELPVLVKHLRFFIFPAGLNIDHQTEIYKTFFAWPVAGSALILALYLLLAFLALRSKALEWRVVSFFMIWFFIVLLPTIVIPLNAVFQENRGYLAILVFAVFAGVLLGKLNATPLPLMGRGRVGVGLVALIILVSLYGAETVHRNGVWQDGMRLWSDAAAKSPESSRAHTNLGTEYARRGMNEAAIGSLLKALRLSDSDGGAEPFNIRYNLGTVYQQMGRDDMAVREYRAVIDLRPQDFRPWYNLGVIYQQNGEAEAAMRAYERVIERNPSHFKSYHNMGLLYHNRGETSLAAEYYRKALSINPGYARSRANLEAIYKQR